MQTPQTVSGAVADRIRLMTDAGALPPGERINEVHLAQELGVSRTPLREALNRLVADQVLEARPRIGFFVRPLTAEEMLEVYTVRPILDCAALDRAGLATPKQLADLAAINKRFAAARAVERRIDLDDEFHLALVAGCDNSVMIDLIRRMMARTRRYEIAYLSSGAAAAQSAGEHGAILDALESRDLKAAVAALRANLTGALEPMLRWLNNPR